MRETEREREREVDFHKWKIRALIDVPGVQGSVRAAAKPYMEKGERIEFWKKRDTRVVHFFSFFLHGSLQVVDAIG